ncbi:MAG TPA: hypothetical protein VMB03_21280 [Bryobacteraceae bacterium]|nr:hypothetical protein [Bryobacteraceae bacterium]
MNVGSDEQRVSLANRIALLTVVPPLEIRDPAELPHAVTERMRIMKEESRRQPVGKSAAKLAAGERKQLS